MSEDPDKEVWEYLDGPGEVEEIYGLGYFRKPVHKKRWETKDSGERFVSETGYQRDTENGKGRFDLMFPLGIPYDQQMMTRFAQLLARGAEKYDTRNWEKANSQEDLDRFKSSAFRHLVQWLTDEQDEDHGAAVIYNIMAHESTKWKLANENSNH